MFIWPVKGEGENTDNYRYLNRNYQYLSQDSEATVRCGSLTKFRRSLIDGLLKMKNARQFHAPRPRSQLLDSKEKEKEVLVLKYTVLKPEDAPFVVKILLVGIWNPSGSPRRISPISASK